MRVQQRAWRSIVLALACAGCLGGQTGDPGTPVTTRGCSDPTKTLDLPTARAAGALPGTWLDGVLAGGSFEVELAASEEFWRQRGLNLPESDSATLVLSPARSVLVLPDAADPAAQLASCPDTVRVQFDAELTLPVSGQAFDGSAWLSPVAQGSAHLSLAQLGGCRLGLDGTGRPSQVTCP